MDPTHTMRHPALYVIKAQAPGIVEYLYDQTGATRRGKPLVRLYDPTILTDLRIGESAMSRFAASPFIIASRQVGLPPLPPSDFPRPTALQRLLGIRPTAPTPAPAPLPVAAAPIQLQFPPSARSGLSRTTSLAPQSASPAPTERVAKPSVRGITRLSSEMADLHDRMNDLNGTLSGLDDAIATAQESLSEAKDDAAARERLFNQGVLARNAYESAKSRVASLQDELDGLRQKRAETIRARDGLLQSLSLLQDQMDAEMAQRAEASATLERRDEDAAQPQPTVSLHREERRAPASRQRTAPPAAAQTPSNWFPSPTQQARPELGQLPRQAGRGLRVGPEIPAVPMEVKRLGAPRWVDQSAPGDGLVVRQLAPNGSQVQPGTPLLEVADREWARIYSDVPQASLAAFAKGAPVRVSFDNYPGVTLEGWINDRKPLPGTDLARVEMLVMAREGYCPDDTYASLEWLVLAAPIVANDRPEGLSPALEAETPASEYRSVYDLLPLIPSEVAPASDPIAQTKPDEYVGLLRLGEVGGQSATALGNPAQAQRLSALHKWRDSFTSGMTTGIFGNLVLTYPRDNEIGRAVEKMATVQVTHEPDRCARTMREALGWGLGDAAVWMDRLPERGYKPRTDGLARPGDILVWPFTYGPRRSQHIGVAVSQGGKLMLLSNLSGTLGTTELQGGYVAFYRPAAPAAKPMAATKASSKVAKPYLVLKAR